jgi:hypothetical protein
MTAGQLNRWINIWVMASRFLCYNLTTMQMGTRKGCPYIVGSGHNLPKPTFHFVAADGNKIRAGFCIIISF